MTTFLPDTPDTNQLIESLPEGDRQGFLADCDIVDLTFGQVLLEPGEQIRQVHLPLGCIISLIVNLENKAQLEVSMIGNEGMSGSPLILGAKTSPLQALVHGAGSALCMSSACFLRHLEARPALEALIKRYVNVRLNQISQSAACAHYHGVEPRLASCLLMAHDRTRGNQLRLTHEFLSSMLGVRRAGISEAAKALHKRGLIVYQRGRITVEDRAGLEKVACSCYDTDRAIYDQMFRQGLPRKEIYERDGLRDLEEAICYR